MAQKQEAQIRTAGWQEPFNALLCWYLSGLCCVCQSNREFPLGNWLDLTSTQLQASQKASGEQAARFSLKVPCWDFVSHRSRKRLSAPVAWAGVNHLYFSVFESDLQWGRGAEAPCVSWAAFLTPNQTLAPWRATKVHCRESRKLLRAELVEVFSKKLRIGMDEAWMGMPGSGNTRRRRDARTTCVGGT